MKVPLIGYALYVMHKFQLHLWTNKFQISYQATGFSKMAVWLQ